jgi:hypothetical protein
MSQPKLIPLVLLFATLSVPFVATSQDGGANDSGTASSAGEESPVTTALGDPETVEQAIQLVSQAFDMALAGQWLLLAILLIQLGVFLIKRYAPSGYMKAWGSVTVGALAALIAVLSGLSGGLSWQECLVVFLSGPASSLAVDFLHAMGWLKRKTLDA